MGRMGYLDDFLSAVSGSAGFGRIPLVSAAACCGQCDSQSSCNQCCLD